MKILIVGSKEFPIRNVHSDVGGIDVYIQNLTKYLQKLDYTLYVFSRIVRGNFFIENLSDKITVIHTPYVRSRLFRLILSDFISFLYSLFLIRRWKIDIIHVHETVAGFFFSKIARIMKIPLIGQIHTFGSKQPEWPNLGRILLEKTENISVRSADTVILLCREARDDVIALYGCPPNKIEIIPNAVDFERFKRINVTQNRFGED